MHELKPPLSNDVSAAASEAVVPRLPSYGRSLWGVLSLFGVTMLAMAWAWHWPDQTLWHFWLVAQAMPVFYVALVWWGAQAPTEDGDAV